MNKRNKILIIVLIVLILTAVVAYFKLLRGNDKIRDDLTTSTATLEEREEWSKFLNKNPYLSEIQISEYIDDTDIIKLAITSEEIETDYIVTEEININPVLSTGDGYKKSKEKINEYAKKKFNQEEILYNFVETYSEGEEYLMVNDEYVYYTKIKLPKREYILMEIEKEGNNFEALIYEYEINDSNESKVKTMLETGNIDKEVAKSKVYMITGTINNGEICVLTKT